MFSQSNGPLVGGAPLMDFDGPPGSGVLPSPGRMLPPPQPPISDHPHTGGLLADPSSVNHNTQNNNLAESNNPDQIPPPLPPRDLPLSNHAPHGGAWTSPNNANPNFPSAPFPPAGFAHGIPQGPFPHHQHMAESGVTAPGVPNTGGVGTVEFGTPDGMGMSRPGPPGPPLMQNNFRPGGVSASPPDFIGGPNSAAAAAPGSSVAQQHQAVMSMMGMLASMPGFNIPGMPGIEKFSQADAPDISIAPNKTLYVNNLNDKIKPDQLQKELRAMFANFGKILDIVAMKSFWRRGQAWIIFAEQEAATKALIGLQGFEYHGKPMRINYAHDKSDIFTKQDGTFTERPKGPRRPKAIITRESRLQQQIQRMMQSQQQQFQGAAGDNVEGSGVSTLTMSGDGKLTSGNKHDAGRQTTDGHLDQRETPGGVTSVSEGVVPAPPAFGAGRGSPEGGKPTDKAALVAAAAAQAAEALQSAKKRRFDAASAATPPTGTSGLRIDGVAASAPFASGGKGSFVPSVGSSGGASGAFMNPFGLPFNMPNIGFPPAMPNATLFVEGLPETCTEDIVLSLFRRYPGLVEVRLIPSRKVAFIEFESESLSGAAMNGLQNFEVSPGKPIRISYAKR